jgi:hypothetical protein
VPFFVIDSIHGDPGGRYETREEALAVIDGMVRDGIAEAAQFSVIERDQNGDVVDEPFGAPSEFGKTKTTAA